MATVQRFEDLEAWRTARVLTKRVYEVTREGAVALDFGYRDQIRCAALYCDAEHRGGVRAGER